MITAVITMAGLGTRFKKAGYTVPKYQIEVGGKSLFELSISSLSDYLEHISKFIFLVRKEDHATDFIKMKVNAFGINDFDIIELDYLTAGQAETALLAMPYCVPEQPVLIYNIDTYIKPGSMKFADIHGDGHIPCFHAPGDHWSFVRLENGCAVEVCEKKRISNNCTVGAYYFSSAQLYVDMYNAFYNDDLDDISREQYIAPIYNYMIKKMLKVTISVIDSDSVHVLGTPEELDTFKQYLDRGQLDLRDN